MQGKHLSNKKVDIIIQALTDSWCMNVGFPSQGFFADNGVDFANIKLDELTSKLGLSIKFVPSYSSWSNSLNEQNHDSADIIIKKLMEDKKMALSDSIVNTTPLYTSWAILLYSW